MHRKVAISISLYIIKMAKEKQHIPPFTFIDLFAGLGGFHQALSALGGRCLFASELKEDLQHLYSLNFPNVVIKGDITKVDIEKDIPHHDVLCGGFPCQPFSKAGNQEGFNDAQGRGNMFDYIMKIVHHHRPKFVFLENVANLKTHDEGNTWKVIEKKLKDAEYLVYESILSPHEFGYPQHRKRIYIVAIREDLRMPEYKFPEPNNAVCDIHTVIDEADTNVQMIKQETRHQLDIWEEFLHHVTESGHTVGGFPIWTMEFGATYNFEGKKPKLQSVAELNGKRGKFGQIIKGLTIEECLAQLPVYAQPNKREKEGETEFPDWKKKYIRLNRQFYEDNKTWLKPWMNKIKDWQNSHIKFEWNCGKAVEFTLEDKLIQFRASGIRVKLATFAPALNLVGTQIPILPWIEGTPRKGSKDACRGRYLSVKEAAALQGMDNIRFGSDEFQLSNTRIYEALGNAVNVQIVRLIAEKFLSYE